VLWGIIGTTSLSLYIEASFWPNWDGAWHQTMVRDTALTPTHIPMFYFFFPLSVVLALGAYLYGRYRIPAVYAPEKGFPWSFFLLISAAVLEFFQVAFNEWGHSLWLSEEFFAVPFHWPFVTYGWLAVECSPFGARRYCASLTLKRRRKLSSFHGKLPLPGVETAQTRA